MCPRSTANKHLDAQLDNLINTVREEEGDIADLQREIEYQENRLFLLLTGRHCQRVQANEARVNSTMPAQKRARESDDKRKENKKPATDDGQHPNLPVADHTIDHHSASCSGSNSRVSMIVSISTLFNFRKCFHLVAGEIYMTKNVK